jgi:hypothetical protein
MVMKMMMMMMMTTMSVYFLYMCFIDGCIVLKCALKEIRLKGVN